MTQRERIHQMLRSAGPRGIRSDDFFTAHMPRAAARIQELRDSGVEITSEREGKFVRYRLQDVGVGAGRGMVPGNAGAAGNAPPVSVHSDTPEGQLFQLPSRSAFTDSEWAA